ncbi:hypothetical protein [Ereboglobus luteus]|uniref:hypothetical protein n=1 Tax=Ereboglobus luteus TaxID=1796921 RepID=UPI000D5588F9|nr:hypothetical protein [Ereboglobus luteus]
MNNIRGGIPQNIKDATRDAIDELADLESLVDQEKTSLGKAQSAGQRRIQQYIAYRRGAVAAAEKHKRNAEADKKNFVAQLEAINTDLKAFKKHAPIPMRWLRK